jgi:predicted NBD/HSP70 family sugar kinase
MVAPELLSKINERRVLEFILANGPCSRAAMARACEMSAPTASKAVASLIRTGLLEERGVSAGFGRPGKLLQLDAQSANVLWVVVDAGTCWVGGARLDGEVSKESERSFSTPETYPELLLAIENQVTDIVDGDVTGLRSKFRGVGVSVPGLLNSRLDRTVISPNLHLLDGQSLAAELSRRLGVRCVALQESHALCVGERMYGAARGMDDFAMLDVSTGLGLGIFSGGRLLTGNSGMAGELGHITVERAGILCGCGNRGCLETVATDSAFAREISQLLGQSVGIKEAIDVLQSGRAGADAVVERTVDYLAIAVAAVINVFNPSTLFLHGKLLGSDPAIFDRVLSEAKKRTLKPSFADCRFLQSQGNKRLGAVAGIIRTLADELAPSMASFELAGMKMTSLTKGN